MGLDPIADVETVLGDEDPLPEGQDYVIDDDFPEVPLEVVDPSQWNTSLIESGGQVNTSLLRKVVL